MAKRKSIEPKPRRGIPQPVRTEARVLPGADSAWFSPAAFRETIESVIIAFVLAFLFRTFEAEAFVIPTGSMAPTLMGKHKDVECPMCRYRYQVSASDIQNSDIPSTVYHATCPMCRFTADLFPENSQAYPSYDGDRILVAKFPYEFSDPKRWDVIVFKYPGDATMNYIKRLVGLPGETILIRHGDLWICKAGGDHFEIARKPPEKILAMLQPVFDNDLAPTICGVMGWPARWTPEPIGADSAWTNSKDPTSGKPDLSSFEIDGKAKAPASIRYRHRVPLPDAWWDVEHIAKKQSGEMTRGDCEKVLNENATIRDEIPEQLISDFTAYNTGDSDQSRPDRHAGPLKLQHGNPDAQDQLLEQGMGLHWVGDLALQWELESKSASGTVAAELVKGGCRFQCRIDLASGKAEVLILREGLSPDPEADQVAQRFHATAATRVIGAGKHTIIFSNVDDELRLWVDGSPVAFDGATTYDSEKLKDHIPTRADLSPVGIVSEGAAVKVSHLKILRDIYYIAVFNNGANKRQSPLRDFKSDPRPDLLRDPEAWPEAFGESNMNSVEIQLAPKNLLQPEKDRFFVLGDNSAQSSDGRLWVGEWTVERELLIGKALFIYWPHGWKLPYVPLPFNVVPNFQRMRLVR
jgi:signal peptidase I